ncbi:YybH family protein [Streptococcus sp. A11]|uniref:YybH family protein n=1 Tax=unclassified Streptococcus TaxID=2608887 RepID=UPI00374D729F
MVNSIEEVLDLYKKAVLEKNPNLMLSLYCDDVVIYDVAGQWSMSGKQDLADMVAAWFQEIGSDRADVEFSNLAIHESQTCAFAYFDARFSKIGFEQSVTDRFTMGLIYEQGWKIKHQHASHPIERIH